MAGSLPLMRSVNWKKIQFLLRKLVHNISQCNFINRRHWSQSNLVVKNRVPLSWHIFLECDCFILAQNCQIYNNVI